MAAELKPVAGGDVPLFERLIDFEPGPGRSGEPRPFRILDADDMVRSIRRELARLLGTRRPVGLLAAAAARDETLTVRDYGLPDTTGLSPHNSDHRLLLAGMLERIIAAYEPRLRRVAVTVDPDPAEAGRLIVRMTGERLAGTVVQTVSFPLALDGGRPDELGGGT